MATHQLTAEFFGSPVSIIDHQGKRWLTAEEAGRCLGYNEANAGVGVRNLYNRHADEFTDADACRIKLMRRDGKTSEQLIFSGTGCTKLGFFANTPKAKQFRAWAAQTLEAGSPAPAVSAQVSPHLKMNRQKERIALEMFVAGHTPTEIAKHFKVSRTLISLVVHGKYQFAPGSGAPECSPELIAAVAAKHLANEQAALAQAQERAAQRFLTTANNQDLASALEQVGRHLQQPPALALSAPEGGV